MVAHEMTGKAVEDGCVLTEDLFLKGLVLRGWPGPHSNFQGVIAGVSGLRRATRSPAAIPDSMLLTNLVI